MAALQLRSLVGRIRSSGQARTAAEREEFFARGESLAPMVAVDAGRRGRFLVRTDDLHIGRSLFVTGRRSEMEALERAIEVVRAVVGGDAFVGTALVDVGANIGTTTVPALLSGTFDRALAIEPEAANFVNLRLNLVLNDLESRVAARQLAASDSAGSAYLRVSARRSGKHHLEGPVDDGAGRGGANRRQVEVPTATLDAVLEEEQIRPEAVGLLWVDAEGAEDRVLAGAARVLEHRPPVAFELNPNLLDRTGGSQEGLERLISAHYSHFLPLDLVPGEDQLRPLAALPDLGRELRSSKKKRDLLLLSLDGR